MISSECDRARKRLMDELESPTEWVSDEFGLSPAEASKLVSAFEAEVERRLSAERDTLKSRLDRVLDIYDREQRNAMSWENPIPVPEWVGPVQRAALGDDATAGEGQ